MPRPTEQSAGSLSGGGFGSPADDAFNLGQIDVSSERSLDVDGATQQAQALAQVFNKTLDLGMHAYQNSQNAATEQGQTDATLGTVDQARLAAAGAYATGVQRVNAQNAAITAAGKAKQFAAQNLTMPLDDSTDENGQTVPGLITRVQQVFQQALPPGIENDPIATKLVTPIIQHSMNEITGAAYQNQIQNEQQQAEDTQQALIVHDAQNPGGNLFDPALAIDSLTKVYQGNQRVARDALVHAVGEAAVQTGQPGLIQKYLPNDVNFGNGATLTPDNLSYLDGARNRATMQQTKTNDANLKSSGMAVVQAVADGKDPHAALQAYMTQPGADPSFARSMLDWTRQQGTDAASHALDTTDAARLQSQIALGKITTLEQAQQAVAAEGYTAGAAVQLVTHAASWLSEKHQTDESDPQFVAARSGLDQLYRPGLDPTTGQFTKPEDVQKHANVLSDFITQYQQLVNQGNISSADAAHKASTAVQQKYGPPAAIDSTPARPTSDADLAAAIRNSSNMNPTGLNRLGITPDVIKRLRDENNLDSDTAATALRTWLSANQAHK